MRKIFYDSDERIQQMNTYYFGIIGLMSVCVSFLDVMIRGFILGYSFSYWCVSLFICLAGSLYYLVSIITKNTHYPLPKRRAFYLYFYVTLPIVSIYVLKDFYLNKRGITDSLLKFVFLFFMSYVTLLVLDRLLRKLKAK